MQCDVLASSVHWGLGQRQGAWGMCLVAFLCASGRHRQVLFGGRDVSPALPCVTCGLLSAFTAYFNRVPGVLQRARPVAVGHTIS